MVVKKSGNHEQSRTAVTVVLPWPLPHVSCSPSPTILFCQPTVLYHSTPYCAALHFTLGTAALAGGRPSYQGRINRIKETLKLCSLLPMRLLLIWDFINRAFHIYQGWIKHATFLHLIFSVNILQTTPFMGFANFRPGWDVEIARLCARRPISPTLAQTHLTRLPTASAAAKLAESRVFTRQLNSIYGSSLLLFVLWQLVLRKYTSKDDTYGSDMMGYNLL